MRAWILAITLAVAASADASERPISVLDVLANFDDLKGKHVSVDCLIVDVGYPIVYCYGAEKGYERILIRTYNIDGKIRRNLLMQCVMPGCNATVSGVLADVDASDTPPMIVKDIKFTLRP